MAYPLPTEVKQILTPTGEIVGDMPDLSDEQLIGLYRWMLLSRVCSDRLVALQRQGRMGTLGPFNGQEASLVGLATPLQTEDWLTGSYREMMAYVVKGVPLSAALGYFRGYVSDKYPWEARCLPVQIVIATQILHALGLAMGIKYEGKPHVAVGVCGDGATSEGDFNEALNFAAVFNAPMIFVVQNNGWAISVPRDQQTKADYIAQRGPGFGMPGHIVDGNDVLAVYQVVSDCVARARAGDGPSLIETLTYRLGAHTTADDPTKYRDEAEYQAWLPRDPLIRYRKFLLDRRLITEAADQQLEQEVRAEMQQAIEAVENWPPQDPGQLFDVVYEQPTPQLRAQKAAFFQDVDPTELANAYPFAAGKLTDR